LRKRPKAIRAAEPGGSHALFAALGDATRLRLVARMGSAGPMSIAGLTAGTRVTRQAITKHLRVLEAAGLARSRRRGRERLWQLESRRLQQARRYLDAISRQWDEALSRLRKLVEQ
jgi:DNA-binding transcriptional ArsR family regulator